MSEGGASVDLGPRSSTGLSWAVDARDADLLELRGTPSIGCLAVVVAVTLVLLRVFVDAPADAWPLWGAGLVLGLAFVRRRICFDRRRLTLTTGWTALGVPLLGTTTPLEGATRVAVWRDEEVHRRRDGESSTHTLYRVDVEEPEPKRVASAGIWEPARELAEVVARFMTLRLVDRHAGTDRAADELDAAVEEPGPPTDPPPSGAIDDSRHRYSVTTDGAAEVFEVPLPKRHQYLALAAFVLVFWTLPVSVFGSVAFGLLPLAVVLAGWLKTAYGYRARIRVESGLLTVETRGLFGKRTVVIPRAELEDLFRQSPDEGGPREMAARLFDGFLVARSDRASVRFGHGLAWRQLERLRRAILARLCAGEVQVVLPPREHALPAWPRRLEPLAGIAAGAVAARFIGGPLATCVAAPYLEHVANAGAALGGALGLAASTWRMTARRTRIEALVGCGLLASAGVLMMLVPDAPGLLPGPYFESWRVPSDQPWGTAARVACLAPGIVLLAAIGWAAVAGALVLARPVARGASSLARATWRHRWKVAVAGLVAVLPSCWLARYPLAVIAVKTESPAMLRSLLAADRYLARREDEWHRTLLHVAANRDAPDLIELLLSAGADPNARDWSGRTALHYRIRDPSRRSVTMLLDAGADPNAATSDGETPLHVAAHAGRPEVVRLLVERGARVNAVGPEGYTPLHLAAINEEGDARGTILALQSLGADPTILDSRGRNARQCARQAGLVERLKDLLVFEGPEPAGEEP